MKFLTLVEFSSLTCLTLQRNAAFCLILCYIHHIYRWVYLVERGPNFVFDQVSGKNKISKINSSSSFLFPVLAVFYLPLLRVDQILYLMGLNAVIFLQYSNNLFYVPVRVKVWLYSDKSKKERKHCSVLFPRIAFIVLYWPLVAIASWQSFLTRYVP